MQLPSALRPWHGLLSLFPQDIAVVLGRMIQRLYVVVGPLRENPLRGLLEPDGVQGISQRGIYERLVLSEWLLAEEIPDEFDRRAAMAEHLFYDRDLKEPSGHKESFVLFDSGPEQLGAPRIAQLAGLILLARRAEVAGARFQWGVLQYPDSPLREVVDPAGIRTFLDARTSRSLTSGQIEAWKTRLSGTAKGDGWIVGSAAASAAWPELDSITLEDGLGLEKDVVQVSLRKARRTVSLELELPAPDAVRSRLLRNPFGGTADASILKSRHPIAMKRQLRFTQDGRRVLAVLLDDMLGAFHVPNSPQSEAGRPRYCEIPEKHQIVAAEYAGKTFTLMTVFAGKVYVHRNQTRSKRPETLEHPLDHEHPVVALEHVGSFPRCHVATWSDTVTGIYFLDGGGQLYAVSADKRRLKRLDTAVKDFSLFRSRLYYVRQRDAVVELVELDLVENVTRPGHIGIKVEPGFRCSAIFGANARGQGSLSSGLAIRTSPRTWQVFNDESSSVIDVAEEERVCGVVPVLGEATHGLVVLTSGKRSLQLRHEGGSEPILSTSSAIVQVAVDPLTSNIVYLTETRMLCGYSRLKETALFTVENPEDS